MKIFFLLLASKNGKVMSEYTPQDIIKLIKSNSKSDLDSFRNLIKQFK